MCDSVTMSTPSKKTKSKPVPSKPPKAKRSSKPKVNKERAEQVERDANRGPFG